eukprot:5156110-Amphidinium_carterae.1
METMTSSRIGLMSQTEMSSQPGWHTDLCHLMYSYKHRFNFHSRLVSSELVSWSNNTQTGFNIFNNFKTMKFNQEDHSMTKSILQ